MMGGGTCAALIAATAALPAASPIDLEIERRARMLARAHDVPALGFARIRNGRIHTLRALGYADRKQRIPATADTAFLISSVTKIITGTALLQLSDAGLVALDSPIATYLDFPVVNPNHPEAITFRELLMHSSSISDANYQGFIQPGDPTISLSDFLQGYLVPGGKWYTPEGSFSPAKPGASYLYSNVGFALVGYLAARIAGMPFDRLTAERIFEPLHMFPHAWSLKQLGQYPVATPYTVDKGSLKPIAHNGYPDWPAGLLRTSTRSLAVFIACIANGGRLGAARLLQPPTVASMFDFKSLPPLPDGAHLRQGLVWAEYTSPVAGHPNLIQKTGSDQGSMNMVAVDPERRSGAVVLSNRDPSPDFGKAIAELCDFIITAT
jgi:CubicO group peptidase (beta-lactamase class C family)